MMPERAIFRPDPFTLSAGRIASFLDEFIALVSERPRDTLLEIELPEAGAYTLDLDCGRFALAGPRGERALARSRAAIAEFPVPLALAERTVFLFVPVRGGRFVVTRVRSILMLKFSRLFGKISFVSGAVMRAGRKKDRESKGEKQNGI